MFIQCEGCVPSLREDALRGRLEACFAEYGEAGEKFCAHLHTVSVLRQKVRACVKRFRLASKGLSD